MVLPSLSALLTRVSAVLPAEQPVYLVGGAVRDMLLGRNPHDLDFVLQKDVLRTARKAADALQGAYYPLDEARETGRVILFEDDGTRRVLDFAAFRGPDLESDLRARDFTLNAIAVRLATQVGEREDGEAIQPRFSEIGELIDPLGGAADLRAGVLRACSPSSFQDDPVRTLRAVRQANTFRFRIHPETLRLLRAAIPGLSGVSTERVREELLRIVEGQQAAGGLRLLELLGALPLVLPELVPLRGETQSPPHVQDVWDHTLEVLQRLESLLAVLTGPYDHQRAASMALGEVSLRLGRYREQLTAHLAEQLLPERSVRTLLFFATLYHDSGKPSSRSIDEKGQIRFFQHDERGAALVAQRARELHMSRGEEERLHTIVYHHMRPLLLSQSGSTVNGATVIGDTPSKRAIYRFFRATGPAGVDICLLSLADMWGTYGQGLPQGAWAQHVHTVRALLEAWWERAEETVAPPPLLNGNDLLSVFQLRPGPRIGRLLESLREAQAAGDVSSREQALDLVKQLLEEE